MNKVILALLAISVSTLPLTSHCDDTEIHLGNSFTALEPNVVFIMDLSGSMSWAHDNDNAPPAGEESRLDTVKRIAIDTIDNTNNINLGLMSFNSRNDYRGDTRGHGASVNIALAPIDNIRDEFTDTMNGFAVNWYTGTPITESLDEAIRYISGDDVRYGAPGVSSTMNSSKTQYIKPIANQCQKNHIIFFSDGVPTNDTESNGDIFSRINALSPSEKVGYENLNDLNNSDKCKNQNTNGLCAEELALLAQVNNLHSDSSIHQNITIHTVGGFVGGDALDKLQNIAKFGSPLTAIKENGSPSTYYPASNADELALQLKALFTSITDEGSTFTAPSVSVNAFNSLELSDELYYALFKPSKKTDWVGNLKRYRLKQTTTGTSIVGQDDQPAVDEATAFFKEDAISFWGNSNTPDGLEVAKGGIAQHLGNSRNIKTIKNGALVDFSSSTFTKTELNIIGESNDYQQRLLSWARGIDVDAGPNADGIDEDGNLIPRLSIEDPLHSEPTIITYSSDKARDEAKRTLFLGTNSGFLHAFDINEDAPREHFSFIPEELLQNLNQYYSGGSFNDHKTYGLDGPLTHWHDDNNHNASVDSTDGNGQVDPGEHVYLYITMRRGGQSLYALDVTDPDDPSLLWQKHGDYPADFPNKPDISDGYENLGQTWARLEPATVAWNNQARAVLFTAGGYDPTEDGTTSVGPTSRNEHTLGTTIYMIDAKDGEVLWDASIDSPSSEMTSSFAGHVSPVDSTGDGLANIVFAADTGGRIWRFDIKSPAITPNPAPTGSTTTLSKGFAKSALIADINSGSGAGNRRFFNEIDVVYRKIDNDILLSIGSGYRAHPLSLAVTDYHYMIRTPLANPINHTIIPSELLNWGADSAYGWKIPLSYPGEKVLSRSNTSANTTLFTTYAPKSNNAADLCSSDPGIATLYLLNDTLHRFSLIQAGIPAMPVIIRNKEANKKGATASSRSILVGTEVVNLSVPIGTGYDNISRDYWLEVK
jgi:type IV pilus assembly protein PilY1